jgi:hypothetical protein
MDKVRTAAGCLQDIAFDWYQENKDGVQGINSWDVDNNRSFVNKFKAKFANDNKKTVWL